MSSSPGHKRDHKSPSCPPKSTHPPPPNYPKTHYFAGQKSSPQTHFVPRQPHWATKGHFLVFPNQPTNRPADPASLSLSIRVIIFLRLDNSLYPIAPRFMALGILPRPPLLPPLLSFLVYRPHTIVHSKAKGARLNKRADSWYPRGICFATNITNYVYSTTGTNAQHFFSFYPMTAPTMGKGKRRKKTHEAVSSFLLIPGEQRRLLLLPPPPPPRAKASKEGR